MKSVDWEIGRTAVPDLQLADLETCLSGSTEDAFKLVRIVQSGSDRKDLLAA